jgi:hypothetical protein
LLHVFPYGRPGFKAKNPGLGIAQKNTDPSPVEVPTKGGAVKQVKQRVHKPDKFVEEKWAYSLKEAFLRFFGDLKLFDQQPRLFVLPHLVSTLPFGGTLLYDPRSYRIKGRDMRQAMANLQPGDILVRGFDNYVDGKFIPGFFSHAGLYLGRVDEATIRAHWGSVFPGSTTGPIDYAKLDEVLGKAARGEQMVIHAMKDGIFMEDLLNFCRCDYMVGLGFPVSVRRAANVQSPYSEREEIRQTFTGEEIQISEQIKNGNPVPFAEIFPVIFKLALSQLGKDYDFGLDFSSFKKMSCTEFVYYCTKSLEWCSGVHPVVESVIGIKAPGISPDGFAGSPELGVKFASQSVSDINIIPEIKARYPGPYGDFSK